MDESTQPPVILIVDDAPDVLLLLEVLLHNLTPTYDIVTALDARSALRHMAGRTVPLLITDYMMPEMNGLQLTAAVKATSPTTHVILISADDSAALEQRAREQQVDTFLPKAELLDHLEDVVRCVLRRSSPKE
jgi:DNA-binding NarL/FixJ family response regulator